MNTQELMDSFHLEGKITEGHANEIKESIKHFKERIYKELVEILPKIVNTLDDLKELNKNLPNTLQEQSYSESKGYIQCRTEVLEQINKYFGK